MRLLMQYIGSLKLIAMIGFIAGTVWISGWELRLRQRVEKGLILPAPTQAEIQEMTARCAQARMSVSTVTSDIAE